MKRFFLIVVVLCNAVVFAQNNANDYSPKSLFPELFQFKLPITVPQFQFVPEKELYMKEKKLTIEKGIGYRIAFKNNSVFVGSIQSNYGGHENTVSVSFGKMNFANGDRYEGHFYQGHPIQGQYTFANGDAAEIASLNRNGCCNYTGTDTQSHFTFKDGSQLWYNNYNKAITYYAVDGTKMAAGLNPNNTLNASTEYHTKEDNEYKGYIGYDKPTGKWEIYDERGYFSVTFENDLVTGFIPYGKENNVVQWGEFQNGKLIRKVKYLTTNTFCVEGDCLNGEATIVNNKEPEFGLSFEMTGNFKNGNPVGDFYAKGKDANGNDFTLSGPIKDYRFHGVCLKYYQDYPVSFKGDYVNGLPQKGNMVVSGKLVEITGFKEGKYTGKQTFSRSEKLDYSRYYEGEFNRYGQIEGKGTVYINDNNRWDYAGCKITATDWKDGYTGNGCFVRANGNEDCERVYFVDKSNFPDFSFDHPFSKRDLAKYEAEKAKEREQKEIANQQVYSEYQCGRCHGTGVIKTQCPMCKGAGYRKDLVTYNKQTGNTGGPATCSHCGGTGQYVVMGCADCNGKGYVKK